MIGSLSSDRDILDVVESELDSLIVLIGVLLLDVGSDGRNASDVRSGLLDPELLPLDEDIPKLPLSRLTSVLPIISLIIF